MFVAYPAEIPCAPYTNSAGTTYSFAGIGENDCRDVNGNNICSVYTFTIKNKQKLKKGIQV